MQRNEKKLQETYQNRIRWNLEISFSFLSQNEFSFPFMKENGMPNQRMKLNKILKLKLKNENIWN